jgi:hypothetical protein
MSYGKIICSKEQWCWIDGRTVARVHFERYQHWCVCEHTDELHVFPEEKLYVLRKNGVGLMDAPLLAFLSRGTSIGVYVSIQMSYMHVLEGKIVCSKEKWC